MSKRARATLIALPSADSFRAAVRRRDSDAALAILESDTFEVWFGVPAAQLAQFLIGIDADTTRDRFPVATMISEMLRGQPSSRIITPASADVAPPGVPEITSDLFRHLLLRLAGRPCAALPFARRVTATLGAFNAVGDARTAVTAVMHVQEGICAYLAGEFNAALNSYGAARMAPLPEAMSFLLRDAAAKAALVHALHGDPVEARTLLKAAAGIPRTMSWTEPHVDACIELVEATLTSLRDPAGARRLLDAVSLHHVGEMWPAYVETLQLIFDRADDHAGAAIRLQRLRDGGIVPADADGLPATCLPVALAANALHSGDAAAATNLLVGVDLDVPPACIVRAMIALAEGDHHRAFTMSIGLREKTEGLRTLDLWRRSIMASALLGMGEADACNALLQDVARMPGGLSDDERAMFGSDVQRAAEQTVAGWIAPARSRFFADHPPVASLTAREHDVLEGIARGETRAQIAARLFLSENTVKTHQRSLFRKLGVDSRAQALVQADRRGLRR